MARVLYLSTDGLTDPLGESQILPYLKNLAALNHTIYIVSLEKPHRSNRVPVIQQSIAETNLKWIPLRYHKWPPVLATLFDLWVMKATSERLGRKEKIDIIHSRSYLAGLIGLLLKRKTNARLLFDARGFWIDERLEGKIWNIHNPVYRLACWWLRKVEAKLYTTADAIVVLTHKAKNYLINHPRFTPTTPLVEVIPCCADELLFDRQALDKEQMSTLRAKLGLTPSDLVVSYHGSLGTWYLTDELINFFAIVKKEFIKAKLVVITCDNVQWLKNKWKSKGFSAECLVTYCAGRHEIPALLALSSVCVFFIKPVFSKIASSPTKMAEIICMDIPLVTNRGVGDVDQLLSVESGGFLVHDFTRQAYQHVVSQLSGINAQFQYPQKLKDYFSLRSGVERYQWLYLKLSN